MRLPRDVSGAKLATLLGRYYGYEQTRQTGSHMRLTARSGDREHHITIPKHDALRIGTLRGILEDVAEYFGTSVEDVGKRLFER